MNITDKIRAHHVDCMEFMRGLPDNYWDLAIVDPPYGIGANKMTLGNGKKRIYRGQNDWDNQIPNEYYFQELMRVSKNQIIWGANHMTEHLKPTSSWIFWDKGTGENDFSDGELAWSSFGGALRKVNKSWVGANAKDECARLHPTQKPIYLYKWLLDKYAKQGDKIFDSHGGSMSIAIACHDYGFELDVCELDADYFAKGVERVQNHVAQLKLF